MPKAIGIIGTRKRDSIVDFLKVARVFEYLYYPGDLIVSGGCKRGGDRFAEILADIVRIEPTLYLPDESKLDTSLNYKAAYAKICYERDKLIARHSDELIACVSPERTGGTEYTLKRWKKLHPGKIPHIV